jgi:phospholipase C
VIVSPWVPKGHVDHTLYDHTSVLATLESMLGLCPLTARDKAANNLWDQLSETVARTDCPTTLPEPALAPVSTQAPSCATQTGASLLPRSGNHVGFLHVLLKAELEVAERAEHEIVADFHAITTHAHATAYLQRMHAMLEGRAAG